MKTALLVGGLPIAQQLHRLKNNIQVRYYSICFSPHAAWSPCGIFVMRRYARRNVCNIRYCSDISRPSHPAFQCCTQKSFSVCIPYFRVIRRISLISACSLISTYCFVGLNARCQAHFTYKHINLAQHRYLVVVKGSSILKLVEIAMSVFDFHALQEVGAFLSWVTYSNANDHTSEHLATPLY